MNLWIEYNGQETLVLHGLKFLFKKGGEYGGG
jgi:hypothetical protein